MKTMAEIVQETEDYYIRDNNPRGVVPGLGTCKYYVDEGCYCAIGRCLVDPERHRDTWATVRQDLIILCELKDVYKGHSDEFWIYLQQLHDVGMKTVNGVNQYTALAPQIKENLLRLIQETKL